MPIFVYRCGSGHRVERLVPRDADPPACPECGDATRKVPAGPALSRGAAERPGRRPTGREASGRQVPIPWRGVVEGGPEKVRREVEFRERLERRSRDGLRTPGGPDRAVPDAGASPP